jgi:polyferredoxin
MDFQNNFYILVFVAALAILPVLAIFYLRHLLKTQKSKSKKRNLNKRLISHKIINILIAFQLITVIVPWILYYAISGSYLRSIETFLIINLMIFISMLLLIEPKRVS